MELVEGSPPNVAVALARVAKDVGAIAKNKQVTSGPARFNFRGIDDVLDTIHEPMAKHGVSFIPNGFTLIDNTVGVTKSGGSQQHLLGVVKFIILGPAGDSIPASVVAEAQDTSDKAASKMMSMAYKYLAFQVLSIPVQGALDESDSDSTPRAESGSAMSTADLMGTLEKYAAQVGQDLEQITARWRGANGNLTLDAMRALPPDRLYAFVRQVKQYIDNQQPSEGTN